MKYNYKLNIQLSKISFLYWLTKQVEGMRSLAFFIAIVINFIVVIDYQRKDQNEQRGDFKNYGMIVQYLGFVMMALSIFIFVYFISKTSPLLAMKAWKGSQKDKSFVSLFKRIFMTFWYILTDFYFLYYFCYVLMVFLGYFFTPFTYAYHLFEVLVRFPVLLNVVRAVWIPKKQIVYTYFLTIIFIYIFTLFAYYALSKSYKKGYCKSTLYCLLTSIDRSFKTDGGIGGFLEETSLQNDTTSYIITRFLFDNLFFFILMVIMINIVAGIIIDQFGILREDLRILNQDKENYCFICGYSSEVIEKNSLKATGFIYHIKQEHYLWNYLFYIAYLREKLDTEYTGTESYVADKIKAEDISFFPVYSALNLKADFDVSDKSKTLREIQQLEVQQQEAQKLTDKICQKEDT